jgi:hypothetical protein
VLIQDGLIWRRRTSHDYPEKNEIVLPQSLKQDVLKLPMEMFWQGMEALQKLKTESSNPNIGPT